MKANWLREKEQNGIREGKIEQNGVGENKIK